MSSIRGHSKLYVCVLFVELEGIVNVCMYVVFCAFEEVYCSCKWCVCIQRIIIVEIEIEIEKVGNIL
jgi:hypothetical protein